MTPDPSAQTPHRVLVLFAHPAFHKSRVNRVLVLGVDEMPGVTFHDLYEAYPDFDIDVRREQALLLQHDVIVLQHPFFWYSTPAILKEWQDLVLQHGWAYGSEGNALRGKFMMNAVTTGGKEESYGKGGGNRYTVSNFLLPIRQTARLCGMTYLAPFIAHGALAMSTEQMTRHAEDYHRVLAALRDGRLDRDAAARSDIDFLNPHLDRLIAEEN